MLQVKLSARCAVGYVILISLVSYLGRSFSILIPHGPPAFWPPTGVFLAAILVTRPRDHAKLILLGLGATLFGDAMAGRTDLLLGAAMWSVKSLVLIPCAQLIRYFSYDNETQKLKGAYRQNIALIFIGGAFGPALAAVLTSAMVPSQPFEAGLLSIWRYHFAGNSLGIIATTPLILHVIDWWSQSDQKKRFVETLFNLVLFSMMFLVADFVFSKGGAPDPLRSPYLISALLVGIAFRGNQILTTATNLAVSSIVIWHTFHGEALSGIFDDPLAVMTGIQLMIGTIVLTGNLLTAAVFDRNEATRQLAEKHSELERVHAELAAAKEVAVAASEAKSSFLANLSHELRSPLGAMVGFTDLLLDEPVSDVKGLALADALERRSYVEVIKRNALHLGDLIDQILDLSKIEAGKFDIEKEPVLIRQLATDVIQLMKFKAKEKKISLLLHVSPNTPKKNNNRWT